MFKKTFSCDASSVMTLIVCSLPAVFNNAFTLHAEKDAQTESGINEQPVYLPLNGAKVVREARAQIYWLLL